MTRFRKGAVINVFLVAGIGLLVYYAATLTERGDSGLVLRTQHGVRTHPGYPRSVNVATLTEREATVRAVPTGGTNGPARVVSRSLNVAYRTRLPRSSPSSSRGTAAQVGAWAATYPVNWKRRYHAEHAHVQRLLRQLRHARTVQAHVEAPVAWPWVAIVDCETGDGDGRPPYAADWTYNGSSGFDGGPQFEPGTWTSYRHAGEPERAYEASPSVQIAVAERVLADQGWAAWPACSSKVGLR